MDILDAIFQHLHPRRQVTLSGAASALMAKQGQFQAFDAETPIVDATDATNAAGAFRLRFKPAGLHGGPTPRTLVKVWVKPATGYATGNATLGEIVAHLGAAPGNVSNCIVVKPDPTTGKVDLTVALSAGASTVAVVSVEHGPYASAPESITSAAA